MKIVAGTCCCTSCASHFLSTLITVDEGALLKKNCSRTENLSRVRASCTDFENMESIMNRLMISNKSSEYNENDFLEEARAQRCKDVRISNVVSSAFWMMMARGNHKAECMLWRKFCN